MFPVAFRELALIPDVLGSLPGLTNFDHLGGPKGNNVCRTLKWPFFLRKPLTGAEKEFGEPVRLCCTVRSSLGGEN